MSLLVIAPESDLSIEKEVIGALAAGNPTILYGYVSAREFLREMSGDYKYIFISSHGKNDALTMSDERVDISRIENVFTHRPPESSPILVFINACNGIELASRLWHIPEGGPSYVIAWAYAVMDDVASGFAVRFWEAMIVNGMNVRESFDTACRSTKNEHPNAQLPVLLNGRVPEMVKRLTVAFDKLDDLKHSNEKLGDSNRLLSNRVDVLLGENRRLSAEAGIARWMTVVAASSFTTTIIIILYLIFSRVLI